MAPGLTNKQQAFVNFYLTCWDGTKAAILAGYSEKSARSIASENLTKPDILRAIRQRMAELAMDADEVVARLSDQARSTMADFINPETMELDLRRATLAGKLHLVKKFVITERTFKGETTKRIELELHDAQAALVHLGKYHRLFAAGESDDWREQARSAGVDPDSLYEEWVRHLTARLRPRG